MIEFYENDYYGDLSWEELRKLDVHKIIDGQKVNGYFILEPLEEGNLVREIYPDPETVIKEFTVDKPLLFKDFTEQKLIQMLIDEYDLETRWGENYVELYKEER